ncbi:hypothetical protein O181_022193 [Austropuccinia psidii MF-1]|uniref:RNA-directed DNA polymerase n=1 Tax=Austropuccinia psidii MF-1 TaxID=1389203 RepID=A0A9Q3CEQ7_9BASI|nr:hypothetical protein [Austropuccinia psidii MF-1]
MDITLELDTRYHERQKEKGIHQEKNPPVTGSNSSRPHQDSSSKRPHHKKNKKGKQFQVPKDKPHSALVNKDNKLIGSEKERRIKGLCTYCGGKHPIEKCYKRPQNKPGSSRGFPSKQGKAFEWDFFIIDSPKGEYLILGYDFLYHFNPIIDWKNGLITYDSSHKDSSGIKSSASNALATSVNSVALVGALKTPSLPSYFHIPSIMPSHSLLQLRDEVFNEEKWDEEEEPEEIETVLEVVPPAYHQYLDVLSKVKAEKRPPHRACDHHIKLEGLLPPVGVIYSLSNQESETLQAYISEDVEKCFIRSSSSSTGAPVLFVKKKDGGFCLCVDYRKLNPVTRKNRYPVPPMSQLLTIFNGATTFSNIDLHEALSQLQVLKEAFTTAPILSHFNPSLPTDVETDASDHDLGSVLSQVNDSGKHPIAFDSCKVLPAELNYEVHDKEPLGIVCALKHWRVYLLSLYNPFEVLKDHSSLQYFTSSKVLTHCQARWAEFLSEFHFTITYFPGRLATLPDSLSRQENVYPERGVDFISKNPQNFHQVIKQDGIHESRFFSIKAEIFSDLVDQIQKEAWQDKECKYSSN